ncbi:MAG: hypothetical protein LBG66_03530, partial [Gallionellaceae bacterium]|nr:hypothetical protein [Gallionellaceae bacterium]
MLLIQITASHGPVECEYATRLTLQKLLQLARAEGIAFDLLETVESAAGYKSVLLGSDDPRAEAWIADWLGSIQWTFSSPFRPLHKRKNWFVAVQRCAAPEVIPADGEIHFQACKASGAG